MRLLNLVAGQKWTGTAAVVFDQTAALAAAGCEAQYGFVGESPLAERLRPVGWARPLLLPPRGPLDYYRDVRRVADAIRREGFDVVHAHATHDHHVAAWAVRGTGARLVRTLHNLRHARRDPASRWLWARTDAFAFANSEIASAFGRPGPVQSPVIDAARFHPSPGDAPPSGSAGGARASTKARESARTSMRLPPGAVLVGTVGKMADGRGHRDAIGAGAAIAGITLVHVGHGERMTNFQRLAEGLGSADRNLWLGYQEDILPELFRAWDVFLFAASGSEQGQRAILEAMSSGVPVVALDVPGVRDLMSDGREGLLARSPSDLAPALARLASDPDLRRAMGARGRERAMAFTPEKFAAAARSFYENLL